MIELLLGLFIGLSHNLPRRFHFAFSSSSLVLVLALASSLALASAPASSSSSIHTMSSLLPPHGGSSSPPSSTSHAVLFTDIDGTLVHYIQPPTTSTSTATSLTSSSSITHAREEGEVGDVKDEESAALKSFNSTLITFPPTKTGLVGYISKSTLSTLSKFRSHPPPQRQSNPKSKQQHRQV